MESGAMRVSFVVEDKIILCSEMCVNSNEWYREELLWIYTLGYTNLKMSMGTVAWLWNGWIHTEPYEESCMSFLGRNT